MNVSVKNRAGNRILLLGCALLTACMAWAIVLPQAEANPAALVERHLAAGEFAPALAAAERAEERATRDALLQQIATAQHQAGAHEAARQTLRRIGDDRARAGAVDHIMAQQLGGAGFNPVLAQPFGGGGGGQFGGGGGQFGGGGGAGFNAADQADFDALVDLIRSTVDPDTWDEVGGPGAIAEFPGGVLVDTEGVLQRIVAVEQGDALQALRRTAGVAGANEEVRASSRLRKVSLPRLEREIQLRRAAGRGPTEAMQMLAGLQKIQYVFVYPETGDIVLAGPAGDWHADAEGRIVSVEHGTPVLHLDDFVVILRQMHAGESPRFGCSIDPAREALARTQAFLAESAQRPLPPGTAARNEWLERVRATLGKQNVDVFGIDPRTRVARVLVEADYRMKLIGMGLEEGTPGVVSYLDSIDPAQAAPTLDVLRWWFTLDYDAVRATPERDVFALEGRGVKLLSENEMLAEAGRRVQTGGSDALNQRFARSFTEHFDALAARYPIYAELRNMFDMALVAALLRSEELPARANWNMVHFMDGEAFSVSLGEAPRQVDTVINHRMLNRTQIVAGVSGGVRVDPSRLIEEGIQTDDYGTIATEKQQAAPAELAPTAWWWD